MKSFCRSNASAIPQLGVSSSGIQRAARFYYLQQNCFGGKIEGQSFGTATTSPPGLNPLRLEETLSAAQRLFLAELSEVIAKAMSTLTFRIGALVVVAAAFSVEKYVAPPQQTSAQA
ncbi:hypothetical protein PQR05_33045 [Paraburkholderia sediminicola]|uniref:Uncharacterized protein n=1 Tax=Paraburkholderia metrosideri TaxID=580937 RepID=A0ABW9DSS4_9BURK